jgi:hypothetical protein
MPPTNEQINAKWMLMGGLGRRGDFGQDAGTDQPSGDLNSSPGSWSGLPAQGKTDIGGGSEPVLYGDLGLIYQAPTLVSSGSGSSGGPTAPVSGSGSGFVINVIYDSSVSSAPAGFIAGIQDAVQYLESVITTPVTVNIDVGYGEIDGQALESGALGESETYLDSYSYSSIKTALANIDPAAAATLPATAPGTIWLATAQAKALGLASASNNIDAYAGFGSNYPFAYNPNNRAVAGEYDFIGVVEHELTEDLGRIDLFDQTISGVTQSYSLLDLFHYTSPGVHTYTGTTTNYLSVDGGKTSLDYFNSNPSGDLGDWAASAGSDSFLAFSPTDETDVVSKSDVTEMNALGYQTATLVSTPSGTSAVMIMSDGQGDFSIYDLGNSALLASYSLLQTSPQWQVVDMAGFDASDANDLLMRNSATGALELYDVSNSSVTASVSMGQVGTEWSIAGFGDFSGNSGETDMLMRNSSGAFELFDIANNAYTGFYSLGTVSSQWAVVGFGDFSGTSNESDMLMRNTSTGALSIYDISNNHISSPISMGQVGTEWSVVALDDFSGNPGETDMLMRSSSGAFELFDIANNAYTGFYSLGTVSSQWAVVGFGDFSGKSNESDMLMRNTSTGALSLYDISKNHMSSPISMGQVGTEWSIVGLDDFSGNPGETDMLMRSSSGAFELFDIANNAYTGFHSLGTVSTQMSVAVIGADQTANAAAQLAQAMSSFSSGSSAAAENVVIGGGTSTQNEATLTFPNPV